jgi:hypothetical protein
VDGDDAEAVPYRHDTGREPFTGGGWVVVRGAGHEDAADTLRDIRGSGRATT